MNNTITLIEQGSQHPTLVPSQDSVPAVLLFVVFPQGTRLGLSDDMIPDLIQTSPLACQAEANRAPEGAITTADDVQSRFSRYCSAIVPSIVVVRIRLHLHVGVGVGVECLSRNVDRGGGRTWQRRNSGGGRGRRHHRRRMLGMRWGARSVRPEAAGLLTYIECSRVRDSSWMYITSFVTTRVGVELAAVQENYPIVL